MSEHLYIEPGKVWLIFEKVFSWESTVFDNVLKQRTEAVAQRCFFKKVLLESWQNSQENTCARASFLMKLQVKANNFIKKETDTDIFL